MGVKHNLTNMHAASIICGITIALILRTNTAMKVAIPEAIKQMLNISQCDASDGLLLQLKGHSHEEMHKFFLVRIRRK